MTRIACVASLLALVPVAAAAQQTSVVIRGGTVLTMAGAPIAVAAVAPAVVFRNCLRSIIVDPSVVRSGQGAPLLFRRPPQGRRS